MVLQEGDHGALDRWVQWNWRGEVRSWIVLEVKSVDFGNGLDVGVRGRGSQGAS